MQAWFIKAARVYGLQAYKLTSPGRRGFPDLLVTGPTFKCLVELKGASTRVGAQQTALHRKLREFMDVYVVRGRASAEELLDQLAGR